jgi:hypothetical protein
VSPSHGPDGPPEDRPTRDRAWPTPLSSLLLCVGFAAAAGFGFWQAWHPRADFYAYNLPIAVPFAAFFFDRRFFLDRRSYPARRGLVVDAIVLSLALLRVAAPPLPFASGHALFAAYAAATANGWLLRGSAALVLAHVAYTKIFVTGGVWSLLIGLALAAAAALVQRGLGAQAQAAASSSSDPLGIPRKTATILGVKLRDQ